MAFEAAAQPAKGFVPPSVLPPIRNQGDQGSCTGHAVRSHGMAVRRLEHQQDLELSPRFIYWNARRLEGTTDTDAGAEIRDAIKATAKWGFCAESLCRYKPRDWTSRPLTAAYASGLLDLSMQYQRVPQTLTALKKAILIGSGFVFGFSVYENFEGIDVERTGMLDMPKGSMTGGHAVYGCGYDDAVNGGSFLIANSWDTDWGCIHPLVSGKGRGYFWMPYNYIRNPDLAADFWQISKIT